MQVHEPRIRYIGMRSLNLRLMRNAKASRKEKSAVQLQLSLELLLLVRFRCLFPAPIPPKLDPFRVLHRSKDQLSLRHLTGSLELKVRLSAAAQGGKQVSR